LRPFKHRLKIDYLWCNIELIAVELEVVFTDLQTADICCDELEALSFTLRFVVSHRVWL